MSDSIELLKTEPSVNLTDNPNHNDELVSRTLDRLCEATETPRDRVSIHSSHSEFEAFARSIGEAGSIKEGVAGLCVQVDEMPGGPDFRILLRHPLPAGFDFSTETVLTKHGVDQVFIDFLLMEADKKLAFLFFHELAHNRLRHVGYVGDDGEDEANSWAIEHFRRFFS